MHRRGGAGVVFRLLTWVFPRGTGRVQHRAALREADRRRLFAGDDGGGNESVAIEIGGVAEEADLGEQQPGNRRLLKRHEPLVGEAERPRSLIGVIEPAQLFLSYAL